MSSEFNSSDLAVEAHGLVKNFGTNRAVDGVDLAVPAGSVYGFLGPNGAGKTTTIRLLATLLRPDAGQASVFGHDVVREAGKVRHLIGVTGQYASVDEDLTARENLILFGCLQGLSRSTAKERADQLLEEFTLTDAASRALKKFSGGMRRRLDLAVSLISVPPLVFLDEPTTGLDPRTRNQMWDTIRSLVARGVTILLTTQYLDEADQLADRIAVIDRGAVVAEGTASELKASVGNSTMELHLNDHDEAELAAEIVGLALGVRAKAHHGGLVTAPLSDPGTVFMPLEALHEHSIAIASVAVAQPTLDEVFLTITGHSAQDADELQEIAA
ncbi:MAG: ATP-binding cassette domain-containing protein [Propionibacteriaceae bacterium]|jgi:ABC-2 type transport system ATP-binding protein|nr:ATP-binding cassette domain-containing protein [Propionibacteriaceae bacterium]